VSGFLTHYGVALESALVPTWPTPAQPLARLLPWTTASMEPLDTFEVHEVFAGQHGGLTLTTIARPAAVAVTSPLLYTGQETLLACALGYAPQMLAGTTYPVPTSGLYRHRLEHAEQLRAQPWPTEDTLSSLLLRRLTVVLATPLEVYELQSAMVSGWQLTATPEGISLAVSFLAASTETDTPVNTWSSVATLLPPVDVEVEPLDLVCRFGPTNNTTPLDDTALLDLASITLQCQRPFRVDQSLSSGLAIAEPSCTSLAGLTGSLTVPYYTAREHGLLAAVRSQTLYTLMLEASGPGSLTPVWRLWCPAVHVDVVRRPWNVNAPTATIPFTVLPPVSVPAWLAPVRYDGRLVVDMVNSTATHPLLGA
jgi:hypothetical protein